VNPPMVGVGLSGLVELAQQHTWLMVLLLWLTVLVGGRLIHRDVQENGEDLESLEVDHQNLANQVQVLDLKQDHIVERQEIVMDRVGVNEQEIQDLRIRHAAEEGDDFFRGGGSDVDPDHSANPGD